MTELRLIYLCNAIDEQICSERHITSDSPAATQKVLQVASALRNSGVGAVVLSLGRGRQQQSGKWYSAKVVRTDGVPVVYAPFFDYPVLTHLVSLICLLPLVWRLRSRRGSSVILAYNRLPHYLLAMEWARLLGFRRFLDLEDGDVKVEGAFFRRLLGQALGARFNQLCNGGGMLAASVLGKQYAGRRTVCCYGVAGPLDYAHDWNAKPLVVLLGGTLQRTTGAQLFVDAIQCLRTSGNHNLADIEFVVTGAGDMSAKLAVLAADGGPPRVRFLGRVSREDYIRGVKQAHVGLALKLPSEDLADTTFPSKVIELSSSGLLLLSTRVSDVAQLFQEDGALYLDSENPQKLADLLLWIVDNRMAAAQIAMRGQLRVAEVCSQARVGQSLKGFFFPSAILSKRPGT
jgi:glycosyltransferase involved in cell wall biosynthesis